MRESVVCAVIGVADHEPAATSVEIGEPAEQLRAIAAAEGTAILVVLDEGGGAGRAWLSASPIRRDLTQLACPAILVPQSLPPQASRPSKVIALVCDQQQRTGVSSVAARLASAFGAQLRFAETVEPHAADTLVVTSPPARGPLASALTGSLVHELLSQQVAPVVVVPEGHRGSLGGEHRAA